MKRFGAVRLGVVGGGGVGGLGGVRLLLGVDSLALVGDVSGVTVVVVGGVGHDLGPAVGKGNAVRSVDGSLGVSGLLSGESGLGVVIGNTVGVGVGGGLLLVGGSVGGGMVGGGRGVVGGSVGNGVSHDGGSVVDDGGGVVDGVSHGVG